MDSKFTAEKLAYIVRRYFEAMENYHKATDNLDKWHELLTEAEADLREAVGAA